MSKASGERVTAKRAAAAPPLPLCPECGRRDRVAHVLLWTYGCGANQDRVRDMIGQE